MIPLSQEMLASDWLSDVCPIPWQLRCRHTADRCVRLHVAMGTKYRISPFPDLQTSIAHVPGVLACLVSANQSEFR